MCIRDSLYTGGGIHTFLADMDILAFFAKHPGVYLVTDKIDDFGLLAKMFAPVKNRMVVEVFSPEKYSQAEKEGFPYICLLYTSRMQNGGNMPDGEITDET